ncbi:MAG: hypothetical protein CFE21_07815 [Bacteroidetes bacterium B1(2017)]|nr:MAG: hypothetical protein CFE21_07815 [Bacteroidetes bacterium B1(2017)]
MRSIFTRVILGLAVLATASEIKAQQDPHYSNFMFNKLTYNAGFAGATDGKICATLLYRDQWVGFGGGQSSAGLQRGDAPKNLVGSLNSNIGKHIGLGLTIVSDELGFQKTVVPRLALSWRQDVGSDGNLAGGIGVGYMQRNLDGDKLKAIDPNDPKIPSGKVSGSAIDLDFGLYYTKDNLAGMFNKFYAGLSATHLNQNKITYEYPQGRSTVDAKMHYYFVTGAEYDINSNLTLQPNIIVKKDPAKVQTDLNCFLVWHQNLRGGLTWRPMDAAVVLLGYQFPMGKQDLYIGYSYDITTSRIIKYSSGSHEIVLRYCFGVVIPHTTPILRSRYTPRFM